MEGEKKLENIVSGKVVVPYHCFSLAKYYWNHPWLAYLPVLLIISPFEVVCSFGWSHEFPVLGVYKCIQLSHFFPLYLFQWKLILLKTCYTCLDHLLLYILDLAQCRKVCPLWHIQLICAQRHYLGNIFIGCLVFVSWSWKLLWFLVWS